MELPQWRCAVFTRGVYEFHRSNSAVLSYNKYNMNPNITPNNKIMLPVMSVRHKNRFFEEVVVRKASGKKKAAVFLNESLSCEIKKKDK